jgi:hypothetical protein
VKDFWLFQFDPETGLVRAPEAAARR